MTSGGENTQEPKKDFEKRFQEQVNCIKEDGIRKELYKVEKQTHEKWEAKWGFLKYSHKLLKEEEKKIGLSLNTFNKKTIKKGCITRFKNEDKSQESNTTTRLPILSSGLIGWGSSGNNLGKLTGPIYVSTKCSVKASLILDEPDLTHQRFIILG